MTGTVRVQEYMRVPRPRDEVVERWLGAFPLVDPARGGGRGDPGLAVRTTGPYRLGWHRADGRDTGTVTFADVTRSVTAVRVDACREVGGPLQAAAVRLGLRWRTRRALHWFARAMRSRGPATPVPSSHDEPGPAPVHAGDRPLPVGIPTTVGVVAGAAHASGSPGGSGSLGASSDRVRIGGRVGPADVASVPAVAPVGQRRD